MIHKTLLSVLLVLSMVSSLFFASPYVFGFLTGQNTINTSGIVANIGLGVYVDDSGTQPLISIDWGICNPEEPVTAIAYIQNLGTVDVTLKLDTTNWNPSAATSLVEFSEDGSGKIIKPGETIQITFTVTIVSSSDHVTHFAFDIIIQSYS